jgi:hypothetical protein
VEGWRRARHNIGLKLCIEKRGLYHADVNDMQKFMSHMLSKPFDNRLMHRQVMLWASLLFFTGMRPGEAAYSSGYKEDCHYLRVRNILVGRFGTDKHGVRFSVTITVEWMKHNRYKGVK